MVARYCILTYLLLFSDKSCMVCLLLCGRDSILTNTCFRESQKKLTIENFVLKGHNCHKVLVITVKRLAPILDNCHFPCSNHNFVNLFVCVVVPKLK